LVDMLVSLSVACSATTVVTVTADVATVNVPVVEPAFIVSVPGTAADDGSALDSVTVKSAAGAALSVTVAVTSVDEPPITEWGERVSLVTRIGSSVRETVAIAPPSDPEMVTGVATVTFDVVTVKVAVRRPAGTVTVAGTDATDELLLPNVTTVSAVGVSFSKTVAVTTVWDPPAAEPVERVICVSPIGSMATGTDSVAPPKLAEM